MKINAGWEVSSCGKSICRWFIGWSEIGENEIAGAIAGYCGGGAFIVERFYGKFEDECFKSLWIDLTDRVSGEDIEIDECSDDVITVTESGLSKIWEWNDNDVWCDTDEVVLAEGKSELVISVDDMLYLDRDQAQFLRELCEKAGLTAAPAT
jgi:hypothetical protein